MAGRNGLIDGAGRRVPDEQQACSFHAERGSALGPLVDSRFRCWQAFRNDRLLLRQKVDRGRNTKQRISERINRFQQTIRAGCDEETD